MSDKILLTETVDGVTTLTMNNPAKLNGWTADMMYALRDALSEAGRDDATKVLILTGTGDYYCAGVNLSATLTLGHPQKLHALIESQNAALFDMFIDFPKPILIAANGPAIGASVTSATLCNAIIASRTATFSTPFAALGVTPEGCSSEVFPRLLGDAAPRMLGEEGYKPTADEALEIGLVQRVVEPDALMAQAQAMARAWIAEGVEREYPAGMSREDLREINARESKALATAFLSPPFLRGQFQFLWGKKKYQPALMFLALWRSQPLWGRLLRD
ncbi:MAG: enoyl-CoA hydratase/isomerase family protein [Nannocystaceae bacterium]